MSCDGCALAITGCVGLKEPPCVKLQKKKESAERQEAERKRKAELNKKKCKNCGVCEQEWGDIGFCHAEKKPEATKGEFYCWHKRRVLLLVWQVQTVNRERIKRWVSFSRK